ncbi:MAG: GNAT family N-acetyltransferase [Parcubacteria group bacterium]
MIKYKEIKNFSTDQLFHLFNSVEWIKPSSQKPVFNNNTDCIANHTLYIDQEDQRGIIEKSFLNSTFVASAWEKEKLVGVVRVISDCVQRSIIYDLAVSPDYQGRGIGKELLQRCLKKFPKTQFTLGTSSKNFDFYRKFGFKNSSNYLEKESSYF